MTRLLLAVILMLVGGVAPALLRRTPRLADLVYATLLLAGAALGVSLAVTVLLGAPAPLAVLPGSLPGGPWVFGVDALSAWFLLVVLGVGACAGVFGVGYLAPERGHRAVGAAHALFALLHVGLVGVVTAQAMVPFLAAWEVMAVSAYLLVMFEHEHAETRRAGLVYVVLTHLSTLALVGMFAALAANTTGRSFVELGAANQVPATARTVALWFGLIGFGLKAGAVPLHFWLPAAHAAAPSHVSAVLSGVMLKVGIYGLLRLVSLLGAPPSWFGWALFLVGLISGVLGVLWALAQHELKRLLAYHSVENIGIILLGMGIGVLGLSYGEPTVALLGFAGALLHTLNHALFKSLLFLGAGAVLRATGTQRIDQLGGLWRRLPWTALTFGVASVAIVGLPPLNGFVSEWVVFRGLLAAGTSREALRFAVFGAAGLGLIGALALACFSKVNGVIFLGQRRSTNHPEQQETDPRPVMLVPMLILAGACIAIGFLPVLVLGPARLVATTVAPVVDGPTAYAEWGGATVLISVLGLGLVVFVGVLFVLRRILQQGVSAGVGETWGCAAPALTPRMQYTASSYAAPLLLAYGSLAGVREHRSALAYHSHAADPVQDGLVAPAWAALRRLDVHRRWIQGGRVRWYLLAVIFTLLALLFYLNTAGV
jgi:hydrogenase-4 component B